MYLIIIIILIFLLYKTTTQSGNKSMNLFADKNICPSGLTFDPQSGLCIYKN